MSITLAHVAGIPLEEGLPALAPAASALAILVTPRLSGLVAWLRRR